jgi:hypothetical protein
MISDQLLEHIRIQAESIMTATATVYRKSMVSDDAGGFLDTYSAVGIYPCSYAPIGVTPTERERPYGVEAINIWRFQATDRIETDSRSFEVVDAGGGSIRAAVRVITQEIT